MNRTISKLARAMALPFGLAILAVPANAAQLRHSRAPGSDIEVIRIDGDLTNGDITEFRELALRLDKARVELSSAGGLVAPAIAIGRIIRFRGFETAVVGDTTCTSACALIWLAGSKRFLSPQGRLGFHAGYVTEDGASKESGVANALIGYYLSELDLPQNAVVFVTSASPTRFNWLSEANRDEVGIPFIVPGVSGAAGTTAVARTAGPAGTAARPDGAPPAPPRPPAVLVPPPAPAVAAVKPYTRAEMRQFLAEMLQRPGIGQEMARTLGYEPPVDSLVAEHFQLIYRNNLLIDRAVDEIMAVQSLAINPVSAREMGREIGAVLIAKLIASGLRRLPTEQQKRFFDYYSQIPAKLSDAECRAMFNVAASDATLEFKAVARISPEALREYLAIIREAVGAELAGTSPVPDLNIRQKQIADDAAQAVTFKALAGLSEAERMSIAQAMAKSDGSPEACRGYRLIFPPLFQMPGIVGDWLRADSLKNMGTGL